MPEQAIETKVESVKEVASELKTEDILSRVAKFKDDKQSQTQDSSHNEDFFDYKEIEKIADPVAKDLAFKAYKSMQRGFTRKTQEIADIRKTYEQKMAENSHWSPERVKALLNDQEFVKSAEVVAGLNQSIQAGEQPQIPEAEKRKIAELDNQMKTILNQNAQLVRQQQHEQIKQRYANYDPNAVDGLAQDLLQGKVTATPEHLWKVLDYESAVQRAYRLGLEDRKLQQTEKLNASTTEGVNVERSSEPMARGDKEHPNAFFKRILEQNLLKSKVAGAK